MNSEAYDVIASGNEAPCAGCGVGITDRYYLSAVGRRWHVTCLHCCACQRQLDATSTCYMNNRSIYCAHDFRRLFVSRACVGCLESIQPEEMVMWIRDREGGTGNHVIYHARCFACVRCDGGRPLSAGEHYGIQDGRVYCRAHFCEVQMELRQVRGDVCRPTRPTVRRTGVRGRPRKLRTAVRPPDNPSPRLCDTGAVTTADIDHSLDQNSERMSSDVSDDAMRDDTNSPSGGGGSSNGAWDDTATGNSSTRRKRMRSSFKHHQLKMMKSHFQLNHNPDAKELREIALKTGLMTRVIQVWFQNARAKFRRNLFKQQQQQQRQQQVLAYVTATEPITSSPPAGYSLHPPWDPRRGAVSSPLVDDDAGRHVTDPDFRYALRDVIGACDRPPTQCRDCCTSVEMDLASENSPHAHHYQQLYQ